MEQLSAELKSGDIDYGFLYKSTCLAHDIRFISLDPGINLGARDRDYSASSVTFQKKSASGVQTIRVKGSPITYSLSIPSNAPNPEKASRFIIELLSKEKENMEEAGFIVNKPIFYGSEKDYLPYQTLCRYGGSF